MDARRWIGQVRPSSDQGRPPTGRQMQNTKTPSQTFPLVRGGVVVGNRDDS